MSLLPLAIRARITVPLIHHHWRLSPVGSLFNAIRSPGILLRSMATTPTSQIISTPPDITPLKLATDLYAIFRIHNRPYLVTEGDKVILPFHMKEAQVGDILNLTDVTTLGSRNFTLQGSPINSSLYELKATVIEKTKRKFEVREVTKRRQRRVRHAKSKGDLTILRIHSLQVT